ncbi:MAG: ferritin-like domain-containing protein [Methylotenera sp.]
MLTKPELREISLKWLCESDAAHKSAGVYALGAQHDYAVNTSIHLSTTQTIPGRPHRPELVSPLSVKKRAMNTQEGRAALIHALAHIEFNAINLALDAIWRFSDMPENYYRDWLKVATEEAYHFSLLSAHLGSMGYKYGDFTGHDSLWEMVDRTKGDVLARMALVPRTMEARGLDALPALRAKLAQAGDIKAAEILDILLRDEVGHVTIGNYWFNWLCSQRGLEPITTYEQLAQQYSAPKLRAPFNLEARRKAGFSEAELANLMQI